VSHIFLHYPDNAKKSDLSEKNIIEAVSNYYIEISILIGIFLHFLAKIYIG